MQLLSARWHTGFGTYTLGAALKTEVLEQAVLGSYQQRTIPAHPESEMKISGPCALLDPNGAPSVLTVLDGNGNTWAAFGIRQVANTPNPAIVEATFRERATSQFGENWSTQKKKRLNGLRKAVKNEVAGRTPFRLTECGAMFICLGSGDVVAVGNAAIIVAKDLVGRVDALARVSFGQPSADVGAQLLAVLRRQEESITPWPTGTASLRRKRQKENESCSVKLLNWGANSQDAHDLLHIGWKPCKIELQWGESGQKKVCEKASVGLTGRMESLAWGDKLRDADPLPQIEARLARLLAMDAEVRALLMAAAGTTPLPMQS